MSLYKINSISTVGYGKYSDVSRVIATKERNLIASLFCENKDTIFIISKEVRCSKFSSQQNKVELLVKSMKINLKKKKRMEQHIK